MAYVQPVLPVTIYQPPLESTANLGRVNDNSPAAHSIQMGQLFNTIMQALNSMCFSVAGSAIATTTQKAKTVNAVQYTIKGKAYTKAAADNFWTLDTTCNVTNGNWNGIWLMMDASGAAQFAAGTQASSQAGIVMPTPNVAYCVIAYLTINPTGSGNFVGGTTSLSDGSVVPNAVFYDMTFPGYFSLLT